MVTPRPLKLKRELGRAGVLPSAKSYPIARLWVDTGIFHLDGYFDYLVPEIFSDVVQVGVRVEVEFGSSIQEGLVLERLEASDFNVKFKSIQKVLSAHPVATRETIALFLNVCSRWAAVPFDIIRSAIPPRVAAVDKESFSSIPSLPVSKSYNFRVPEVLLRERVRAYWSTPPSISLGEALGDFVRSRMQYGQILIVCSDERELLQIESNFSTTSPEIEVARIDGGIPRAERYRNFLKLSKGFAGVGLSLRGGVFAPLQPNSTIIVVSESSELLHEPRTPGWNARDVALLRSSTANTNLLLVGFTPSFEVARLIENKWLDAIDSKIRCAVIAEPQSQGSLLPSKAFSTIRRALESGPVLCLVPRKGYGNAVLCSSCRNIALCPCGGRLQITKSNNSPECALCGVIYDSWNCSYCRSSEIYLSSRGIDRYAEEIGKAFPNTPVINSSGDHIVNAISLQRAIVIATPGAEPIAPDGYRAVALLEGLQFFASSDIRASERTREQFFSAAHLVANDGFIFVAIDSVHPIVAALTRWDALPMIRRELNAQEAVNLPPFHRFIALEIDTKEAQLLHTGLTQAVADNRIPKSTIIRGPHAVTQGLARILVSAPVLDAPLLVSFIQELQRRRSLSHKSLMKIRVDPYSLT